MINNEEITVEHTRLPLTFVSMRVATLEEWINMGNGGPMLPSAFSTSFDFKRDPIYRVLMRDYAGNLLVGFSPQKSPFIQLLLNSKPNKVFYVPGWRKVSTNGSGEEVIEKGTAFFMLDIQYVQLIKEAGKNAPTGINPVKASQQKSSVKGNHL